MLEEIIKIIWPLLVLQVGLQIIALVSLYKKESVRFNNKWIWVVIIILGSLIGPIVYYVYGGEKNGNSRKD